MKKLCCIIGMSCSGKDSLVRAVERELGLQPVVSYTTRPRRDNETDGVEHYFITKKIMEELCRSDKLVAYTSIGDKNGSGFEYGTTFGEVTEKDIYIIDPEGYEYLKSNLNPKEVEVFSVYIHVSEIVRLTRAIASERGDLETTKRNFLTRTKNEFAQFDDFYRNEKYDYLIDNSGSFSGAYYRLIDILKKEFGFEGDDYDV